MEKRMFMNYADGFIGAERLLQLLLLQGVDGVAVFITQLPQDLRQ